MTEARRKTQDAESQRYAAPGYRQGDERREVRLADARERKDDQHENGGQAW